MRHMKTGLFACCLALASAGACALTQTDWEIHSLGTLGGDFSIAVDLNNLGQVVGDSQTEPRIIDPADPPIPFVRAFISAPDGGPLTEIQVTTGGFFSHATAVNDFGQVVGTTTIGRSFPTAFVTGPNGSNMMESRQSSRPADIDNVAQTVFNDIEFRPPAAVLANNDGNGVVIQITTPDDVAGIPPTAVALNDQRQVAVNGARFGYIWTVAEGARNLTPGAFGSRVVDINNAGQVLGVLVNDALLEQVFLTAPNGGPLTLIGTPGDNNDPAGLNILGQIVGTASFAGEIDGYVTGPGGSGLTDLDALAAVVNAGWTDLSPVAINDVGQIAGTGLINGQQRAFLLTPVPEPETYALLLAGFGLLGLLRKRSVLSSPARRGAVPA
jgi:uncharacterized membrane protein